MEQPGENYSNNAHVCTKYTQMFMQTENQLQA